MSTTFAFSGCNDKRMRNRSKEVHKNTIKQIEALLETVKSNAGGELDADSLDRLIEQCARLQEQFIRLKVMSELESESPGIASSRSEPETDIADDPAADLDFEQAAEQTIEEPKPEKEEVKKAETKEEKPEEEEKTEEVPEKEKEKNPAESASKEEIDTDKTPPVEEEAETKAGEETPAGSDREKEEQEVAEESKPASGGKISLEVEPSLADKLRERPISDLKEAIGLNERFLFSNELFNGNMEAFNRALNELNHLESSEHAERFLNEQLSVEFNWKSEEEVVERFVMLVKRRFVGKN